MKHRIHSCSFWMWFYMTTPKSFPGWTVQCGCLCLFIICRNGEINKQSKHYPRHHRPNRGRHFVHIIFLSWGVSTAAQTRANGRRWYTANAVLNGQQHPPSGMKWPQASGLVCLSGGWEAKWWSCGSLLSTVKANIISSWLLFFHWVLAAQHD